MAHGTVAEFDNDLECVFAEFTTPPAKKPKKALSVREKRKAWVRMDMSMLIKLGGITVHEDDVN